VAHAITTNHRIDAIFKICLQKLLYANKQVKNSLSWLDAKAEQTSEKLMRRNRGLTTLTVVRILTGS
jgi:hypothetical protein